VIFSRTVIGIDPSGKRLALSAVRHGLGRPFVAVSPAVFDLRGDREQARLEESESLLADYVARNGLAGCEARLAVPANKVFLARIPFPSLKEKDLRPALALEMDRIFPLSSSRLKFSWRRTDGTAGEKRIRLIVFAASSEYLGLWEEMVSRTGLSLVGAVPSGWALSNALRRTGEETMKSGEFCAIFRDINGAVECTALDAGEPFFSAARICSQEATKTEALSLLSGALVDAPRPTSEGGVKLFAPAGWFPEGGSLRVGDEDLRPVDGFEARATGAMAGPSETTLVWGTLAAYGAGLAEKGPDLLAAGSRGAGFQAAVRAATGALAVAALILALSWPAAIALRAKKDLNLLDAEIASLRPDVERLEETLAALGEIEGRIHVLLEHRAGRDGPLRILRELTERLPQGTWITGLRLEDRKVEIDGLSPSANEIFPVLTRDGQFRKVEFSSPITRQSDNIEHFQIRAEFAVAPAGKPGHGGGNP
jgi:Tfp pilus assembly protein PilN